MSEVGDQEIGPAVVIVISNADALTPSRLRQAGLSAYVLEVAVPLVVKESGHAVGWRTGIVESGSIDKKYIVTAIAVVVQDGNTVSCRLQNVVLIGQTAVCVWSAQTSGASHILEIRPKRRIAQSRCNAQSPYLLKSTRSLIRHQP